MATLTSNEASAGVQPPGLRVGLVQVAATFSVAASMSSGDVIQMIKVPSGGQVVYVRTTSALQGQGSISVGDGVSTNRYIVDSAASKSSGNLVINNPSFVPYTYSTDDTIDVTTSSSVNFSAGALYMVAIISFAGP